MVAQHEQSLIIRDITEISEMREVEHLQIEVWGVADREVFPALALVPMGEVGGVLLGAFDGGRMAGFVFGFPGREKHEAILHSDMLAVRPEYRSAGLGYRLKLAQRERTLAMGIEKSRGPLILCNRGMRVSILVSWESSRTAIVLITMARRRASYIKTEQIVCG